VGKFARAGVLAFACAALAAGCGGDDDASSTDETPPDVVNAMYERAFSECGSETIAELAGKHNVARNSAAVSTAVAEYWAERFGGREDAIQEAKLGCLESIALETPPGQTKKKSKKKTTTVTVQQP
jgi:hypothetical protein